jgi:D-alanyl-D-alanine carboxypeptidase (penicillin-binding protein 5/6)
MSKHYTRLRGVRKTHKLRRFTVNVLMVSFLGFSMYVGLSDAPARNIIGSVTSVERPVLSIGDLKSTQQITSPMPWPGYGHSAYGVQKTQSFAASDDTASPVPIASLAKVITALAILDKHPLDVGESGPVITLSEQDVELYQEYVNKGGSVVAVEAGAQISLYQALQATMLASANNMADTTVRWVFGSTEEYVAYANAMLHNLGLQHTTVVDASGFSPDSVSTAKEMTVLGHLYMQNPVLLEIALQEEATISVAGVIPSYNSFANGDGMVGIKVGFTDEAMRTYMAADLQYGNGSVDGVSIAVVLGADNFSDAASDARAILKAGNSAHSRLAPPLP